MDKPELTPDRLAAIRAEFERLNGPEPRERVSCPAAGTGGAVSFVWQLWDAQWQGFLLAHTSSEMSKDAEKWLSVARGIPVTRLDELHVLMPAFPDDAGLLRFMNEVHSNVPEDQRPMSISAFSDDQWRRLRSAYAAMFHEWQKKLRDEHAAIAINTAIKEQTK